MAREARTEWVPISSLVKPRVSAPMMSTVERRLMRISLDVILVKVLPS